MAFTFGHDKREKEAQDNERRVDLTIPDDYTLGEVLTEPEPTFEERLRLAQIIRQAVKDSFR